MIPTVFEEKRWCPDCREWVHVMNEDWSCFYCRQDTLNPEEFEYDEARRQPNMRELLDMKADADYLRYKELGYI